MLFQKQRWIHLSLYMWNLLNNKNSITLQSWFLLGGNHWQSGSFIPLLSFTIVCVQCACTCVHVHVCLRVCVYMCTVPRKIVKNVPTSEKLGSRDLIEVWGKVHSRPLRKLVTCKLIAGQIHKLFNVDWKKKSLSLRAGYPVGQFQADCHRQKKKTVLKLILGTEAEVLRCGNFPG